MTQHQLPEYMMTIYNFNGRQFCLRSSRVMQREQRIYERLVKDHDERIVYPYELETADGQLVTRWRHLSPDEVAALLDKSDERPLVERVDWSDEIGDENLTVKRIAPAAHFTLTCTLLDEGLQVIPFDVQLAVEDFVALMLRIMDNAHYGMFDLEMLHPATYQRIMDKCPQPVSSTGRIVFSTAQEILAQSRQGFGDAGDEVSCNDDGKGNMCHVVATINEKHVEFYEEYTEDFDINPVAEVTVDDVPALCRALGVYNADSMLQALEAVLKGGDGTLAPVKAFLNDHHIAFTHKEYE